MSSEVSLNITAVGVEAAPPSRSFQAGEMTGRPAFNAARLRLGLALALSACAHVICLLVLSSMAGKSFVNGAKPILVSLQMPLVSDEQLGPPLAGPPRSLPHETNAPPFIQPIRKSASPASAHLQVVKKEAHPGSSPLLVASVPDVKAQEETMPAQSPTDGATVPATPVPSVTSTQDAEADGQPADRLSLGKQGVSELDVTRSVGQDQAGAAQPAITEAKPLYRRNPAPEYPSLARRMHLEGLVRLEVLVSESGQAAEVRVFATSGHELLDNAAAAAVRSWQFEPARKGGEPVAMRVQVPVRFSLR